MFQYKLVHRLVRFMLIVASAGLFFTGCTLLPGKSPEVEANFPLKKCDDTSDKQCVSSLFKEETDISKRDPNDFPQHYLELYNETFRAADCEQMGTPGKECTGRLERLSYYFNRSGKPPEDNKIGLALEGGGTKAASFSMGTLAGLQELGLLESQVGAISSVSGGSYAASYYFNRWYDKLDDPNNPDTPDDWFRSCIPDNFIGSHHFDVIRNQAYQQNCWEETESSNRIFKMYNEFDNRYKYIGHVWKHHDLMRGDSLGELSVRNNFGYQEALNLLLLFGETAITAPFQFFSRTFFRWPLNSAPTKATYILGLERQYGYSPKDWADAGSAKQCDWWNTMADSATGFTDFCHWSNTVAERRRSRTFQNFNTNLDKRGEQHIPDWILGTTAPGSIGLLHWFNAYSRDPLRQQFELTWDGYGSGAFGYASSQDLSPKRFDLFGINDGFPIIDAVVSSAAFFDGDQIQISKQWSRYFIGAFQHFLNITWFTEIPNYHPDSFSRLNAIIRPFPFTLFPPYPVGKMPYIHLQDGGNAENSAILPLLRRGYKTIIYAHGTEDRGAEWKSICHLKNQLELDGTYSIESPDLDKYLKYPIEQASPGHKFKNHLDELCSSQLDDSDMVTFDENPDQDEKERIPAVARLYCSRLDYPANYVLPCREFTEKFKKGNDQKVQSNLFFDWHANYTVSFKVYRADGETQKVQISTIIAIVPGISLDDLIKQLVPIQQDKSIKTWADWCSLDETTRKQRKIAYCYGPEDKFISTKSNNQVVAAMSCSVMAKIMDDDCRSSFLRSKLITPNFPQDDLILQTIHTTYTAYAANFDLARHQVRHAICNSPDYANQRPDKCLKNLRKMVGKNAYTFD